MIYMGEQVHGAGSRFTMVIILVQMTVGITEQFALWYSPLFVFLNVSLIIVTIIVLVLSRPRRGFISHKKEVKLLIQKNSNKTTLKELLPLVAYPIIFFLLALFSLVYRI